MSDPNWLNRTLWTADNLSVMRGMNSETIDLIYLDPPFNSKRDYAAPIGSQAAGAAFQDTWSLDDVKREWVEDIEADNTAAGFTNGESAQAYLTYMAIRLIEMRRILKPTGSIYLHCDPTMSHYLKLMMDAVFGAGNFRSEITWERSISTGSSKARARRFPTNHDTILFFARDVRKLQFNTQYLPYSKKYIDHYYIHDDGDGRGRYQLQALKTVSGERLETLERDGRIVKGKGRYPRYKDYLADKKGVPVNDIWADIEPVNPIGKEKLGYPTQKPLALLDRIIRASSHEGHMVLDPFCGCATTCVAVERLGRQWAGIDIEPKARELVVKRLEEQADSGAIFKGGILPEIHHLKRPPQRTDAGAPQRSKNIKRVLYERQQGRCAGQCGEGGKGRVLDLDLFEIDHIVPRSKGGVDFDDNLQLLCPTCNRKKGSRTMSYLLGLSPSN